jgi:hypothetical protein
MIDCEPCSVSYGAKYLIFVLRFLYVLLCSLVDLSYSVARSEELVRFSCLLRQGIPSPCLAVLLD